MILFQWKVDFKFTKFRVIFLYELLNSFTEIWKYIKSVG